MTLNDHTQFIWISPRYYSNVNVCAIVDGKPVKSDIIKNWCLLQKPIHRHQAIVDRTNQLDSPFRFDVSDFQHPQYTNTRSSLDQICIDRATEIVDLARRLQTNIVVFYSGGVDSTAVLCALIEVAGIKLAREIITVLMTEHSIEENATFYHNTIESNFNVVDATTYHLEICKKQYFNSIFVTGEPAGALFGGRELANVVKFAGDSSVVSNCNWKDHVAMFHPDSAQQQFMITEMIKSSTAANFQINDIYDFHWWYTVNYRWIGQIFNILLTCRHFVKQHPYGTQYWNEHFISFFDTDDFLLWSYSNKDILIKSIVANTDQYYKRQLKEFIYSCNRDKDYLDTKGKEAYLHRIRFPKGSTIARSDHMLYFLTNDYKTT